MLTRVEDSEAPEPRLSQARLDRIIDAAQGAFLAHGFNGATTDMIQAAAGVSKSTLYRYFPTKEILFEAAMGAGAQEFLQHVGQISKDNEDVGGFLTEFGLEFLQALLSPRSLDIMRLMVMESPRFPKLSKSFYLAGPKGTADLVERYLAEANARGQVRIANPALAAEHFIGMIRGDLYLRCLLGVTRPPSASQLQRFVASTVASFLAAYRPA